MDTFFSIADLVVKISLPISSKKEQILPTFLPFEIGDINNRKYDIFINISLEPYLFVDEPAQVLTEASFIVDYKFRLEETPNNYIVTIIETERDSAFRMISTKDFHSNTIYASKEFLDDYFRIKWMIMAAFGQFVLHKNGLLIHASAVLKDNLGYAFLGVSGTGKSTHSRLWLANIPNCELLNDDNPVIRIKDDGSIWIYGSPWSGKTNCYKAKSAPLKALYRLEQFPYNKFTALNGKSALLALIPSGSALTWNDKLFQLMIDHMSYVAENSIVGSLKCLPNKEAAELSYASAKNEL